VRVKGGDRSDVREVRDRGCGMKEEREIIVYGEG